MATASATLHCSILRLSNSAAVCASLHDFVTAGVAQCIAVHPTRRSPTLRQPTSRRISPRHSAPRGDTLQHSVQLCDIALFVTAEAGMAPHVIAPRCAALIGCAEL